MRWITKETWWRDENERERVNTSYIYICHFSFRPFYFSSEVICALATMCNTFHHGHGRDRRSDRDGVEHGQHLILLHYQTMHCNSHFSWSMTNTLFYFIFFRRLLLRRLRLLLHSHFHLRAVLVESSGVELSWEWSRVEWSGVLIYYIFFLMSRVKGKRQATVKYEFKVHIDSADTVFNCRWIFRM